MMGYLTNSPIDLEEWHRQTIDARDGASVEFLGVVRGKEGDHQIPYLDYEAYLPMAEQTITTLIEEVKRRWSLHQVYLRHRIGRVGAGEVSLLIGVQAPHRAEAFEACQFLIDAIKRDVPIWKKEGTMETQKVQEYYAQDHDRLDGFFKQFQASKGKDWEAARNSFREFYTGLQRHIVWEEHILFPIFEEKTGMKGAGPTEVMRGEHRQIKELLETIHDKTRQQDSAGSAEEAALLDILGAHNQKEEQILYPAIDRMLSDQDRTEVFHRMQNVSEEAYRSCCEGPGST